LWQNALVQLISPDRLINAGIGVINGCLQENNFMLLGLRLYIGLFEKLATKFVLKKNLF
jgi:hypothetical protein